MICTADDHKKENKIGENKIGENKIEENKSTTSWLSWLLYIFIIICTIPIIIFIISAVFIFICAFLVIEKKKV